MIGLHFKVWFCFVLGIQQPMRIQGGLYDTVQWGGTG